MEEGRIIGLDVGEVRTGVALTDELQMIASPFETIQVSTHENDARAVQQIVEEQEAILIVAGIPLGKDGEIGPQAEKVLAYRKYFACLGKPGKLGFSTPPPVDNFLEE